MELFYEKGEDKNGVLSYGIYRRNRRNCGKNNLSKRKSSISSKKKMKKKRVGVRFFKAVITCMLLLVVIGLVGGIIFAKKIIDNTPDVSA